MQTDHLTARLAATSEQDGVVTAGVAENPDGSGWCLLFMSALPGEAEREMSVANEAGRAVDGAVVDIRLQRASLHVVFKPGLGTAIGMSDDVVITLALKPHEMTALREGLTAVVERCDPSPRLTLGT